MDTERQNVAQGAITNSRVTILDSEMAFVDKGQGDPVVFLHGNPTSSYLWRNVIPHVQSFARCLAPDLMGMGASGKMPGVGYRFIDHARYLNAWFDIIGIKENVTLVLHDWGSALGFDWARRNPERVKGLVYMEGFVQPLTWEMWPEHARPIFQALRSPAGEKMVLEENIFIERLLPGSLVCSMSAHDLAAYSRPFAVSEESRRPMLVWPREIPFDGEPADVHKIMAEYAEWLATTNIPKLFINGDPGLVLTGQQREFCRSWKAQKEVTIKGRHFLPEESPAEVGAAIASFVTSTGKAYPG